jgi:hypothetical protein
MAKASSKAGIKPMGKCPPKDGSGPGSVQANINTTKGTVKVPAAQSAKSSMHFGIGGKA